jgi:CRP-like cAMP-binding protein
MTVSSALRQLELFTDCDDADLERAASLLSSAPAAAGDVLIREGTLGEEFMIIGTGEASVTRELDHGDHEVGIVRPGSFVGEISLLAHVPRSATVTALGPLTVYVCRPAEFGALLTVPGVGRRVVRTAAQRLAANRMAEVTAVAAVLSDGTRIRLRPICPNDKGLLAQGMDRLSPESRRRRFFTAKDQLSDASLVYLTEVDYIDHFAWVAFAPDEPGDPIVGVARYIRLADQPDTAEMALTVIDDYQGRGLGSLLFEALGVAGRSNGVERFLAHVLHDNVPMRAMLREAGGNLDVDEPGVLRTVVDIPDPAMLDHLEIRLALQDALASAQA